MKKSLYGLKQAPRALYERLSYFLYENGLSRGQVDTNIFCKNHGNNLMICQIYVDDIIFGSANPYVCQEFSELMHSAFEMSLM